MKVVGSVRNQVVSLYMLMSLILVWLAFVKTQRFVKFKSFLKKHYLADCLYVRVVILYYYDNVNVKCQESDP